MCTSSLPSFSLRTCRDGRCEGVAPRSKRTRHGATALVQPGPPSKRLPARQGGWYEGGWRRGERDGDGARMSRAGAVSAGLWRAGALAEPAELAAVAPAVAAAQAAAREARRSPLLPLHPASGPSCFSMSVILNHLPT